MKSNVTVSILDSSMIPIPFHYQYVMQTVFMHEIHTRFKHDVTFKHDMTLNLNYKQTIIIVQNHLNII